MRDVHFNQPDAGLGVVLVTIATVCLLDTDKTPPTWVY